MCFFQGSEGSLTFLGHLKSYPLSGEVMQRAGYACEFSDKTMLISGYPTELGTEFVSSSVRCGQLGIFSKIFYSCFRKEEMTSKYSILTKEIFVLHSTVTLLRYRVD